MIKLLTIGDSHLPRRAKSIPDQIIKKLEQLVEIEKFDYTFFTGDIVNAPKFMNFLSLITKKNLFVVIGNMDYYGGNRDAPVYQNLNISMENNDDLIIGLTHGHQVSPRGDRSQLELIAIEKSFNILISGHTHKEEIFLQKDILLLNPGSVTGAWSFVASGNPSFITLNIIEKTREINVVLHQYDIKATKLKDLKSYFVFENNNIRHKY
ncbi:MAG: metallophosphoesterase [Candidatus Lokiarchaeota archaeon]|nr:metallophosphoesterase [Candidatus Lokiarchaeota archaeon]